MNIPWLAKLKLRQINLAGAAIMVIAGLPLLMPRVNPLLRGGALLQQQRDQLAVAVRNEKDLNDFLADQRTRLAEIRASLAKEKIRLESARNINQRIARLTSIAAGTGLSVNEILPGATTRGERFDSVSGNGQLSDVRGVPVQAQQHVSGHVGRVVRAGGQSAEAGLARGVPRQSHLARRGREPAQQALSVQDAPAAPARHRGSRSPACGP